jgi:hypothetical protein
VAGEDSRSEGLLVPAREYHDLAVALDAMGRPSLAEIFHREAGIRMAVIPLGGACDRERVGWAVCLADNLASQAREDECRGVLLAALALAEACFGPLDPDVLALRLRLRL